VINDGNWKRRILLGNVRGELRDARDLAAQLTVLPQVAAQIEQALLTGYGDASLDSVLSHSWPLER